MLSEANGVVHADLSVGTNVTNVHKLLANSSICHVGVKLHCAGFLITEAEAEVLGYLRREGIADHIRPYRNGRDLAARGRNLRVIDLYGLSEDQTRRAFPEIYQHLLQTVRVRSEEHTSELQSLMRISYAVFCLKKKNHK